MNNNNYQYAPELVAKGFLAGLLIGGLVGAGAMLLLAPQSGKKTRAKLQRKSAEFREQTAETVEEAMDQARSKARQLKTDVREKAEEFQHRGQSILDEQKDRLSHLVEAGKKKVHLS